MYPGSRDACRGKAAGLEACGDKAAAETPSLVVREGGMQNIRKNVKASLKVASSSSRKGRRENALHIAGGFISVWLFKRDPKLSLAFQCNDTWLECRRCERYHA